MFGGLKKQVDDYYFGYREIRLPNSNEISLPNPYLLRYLTSGNKQKAAEHVKSIFAQRDELVDRVVKSVGQTVTSASLEAQSLKVLESQLNQAGKDHLATIRDKVAIAISCAGALSIVDAKRLGERPPVAKGLIIEAIGELGKKLSDDEDAMIPWAGMIALYIARSSSL